MPRPALAGQCRSLLVLAGQSASLPALACASLLALAACATEPPAPPAPAPAPPAPTAAPPPVYVPPIVAPRRLALCERGVVNSASDGRLFNHLPYTPVSDTALVSAPPQLSPDGSCKVHPAMLADLSRMLAAAGSDPLVAGQIRAVSCHRSYQLQNATFCGGINADESGSFAERAWASAPPGYSEHATGYVVDFGTRSPNGCPDAEACFGTTPVGKWLFANAAKFGFELSFPAGNAQKVKWEPWHWRWVGATATTPGAAAARGVFAQARTRFPATPRVEQ
ncbi:M15 family metallopeptidase [Sphingomonas japonica]|uniref:D-alanyl-D-alanine carboxypeptidase n=1 Tax=Sphingomonas japonica TaxID=511662 RepID=A0ABX0U0N6_9SPHN|nr:M15 family metallopeptidase [Sphingomonas japonica]NIJ24136.1 D-alanyl-D-alanine carboxypeptidase [Sphingomonas japonica]